MKKQTMTLAGVPAILYGERSRRAYLYLHGKNGCKEEAERFAAAACEAGWQVLAIDLPEHGARKNSPEQLLPWVTVPELQAVYAHVTEEQLRRAGGIPTDLGETLSWLYLCWVREHPLNWHGRTQVLYGDQDALTSRTMIERFRQESGAHLTIMEGGEHWFHTPVQMAVLQTWEETNV